jgi:putative ABC transport system permease protein
MKEPLPFMLSPLRHSLRSFRNAPGFTASTLLTLALGIGATTAIFSVLYAVLLRPFPYPDADRLVVLRQKTPQMEISVSWPTAQDWMREQQSFAALSIFRRDRFNIADPGQLPENVNGSHASAGLFEVAALPPLLGRYYNAQDDRPGAAPVVVISESLWAQRYARDPAIIGRLIPIDGVPRTIVGVAPADLDLPRAAKIWAPIAPYAATQESWNDRGNSPGLNGYARLKPGVTLEQARADMEHLYVGLREAHPDTLSHVSPVVQLYRESQLQTFRLGLWSLLAATLAVLAIACANVAGLFVTRGIQQERVYAIRSALGASRAQLVGQMLGESLLIALGGGMLGLLLAAWSLSALQHIVPPDVPRFQNIALNGWVLAFSCVVTALTGVFAGLWPALKLTRVDVRTALHEGSRGVTAGSGIRRVLVAAQVALTLVLLSACGLVLRSLERIQNAPLGFEPASVLKFAVSLPQNRYQDESGHKARDFQQTLVDRLARLPGVLSASVNTTPPLDAGWQSSFRIDGIHAKDERNRPLAEMAIISDDFFATLRIPILQGRAFDARDATGANTTIIDEAFAKKYWPGQDPIGQHIVWEHSDDEQDNTFTVVGVVPTLRLYGYGEPITRPQAYWSLRRSGWRQTSVLVRTAQEPHQLERPVRELFASLDPQIALYGLTTMEEEVAATYENSTLQSVLLSLFAGLAFLLALTGLYGVVAYGVSMRRREIGVRVALGAQNRDVITLMLRQGLGPLLVGLIAGLLGALAAGRLIRSQLYEVSATDPLVLGVAILLLALAAGLACWLPARRAAKVDPLHALRAE